MSNMDQSFSEMREKLRLAISSGVLASTDTLNERGSTVAEIICVDSLDLVELVMAIESAIDRDLDPSEREWLIREIKTRMATGEFGNEGDFDDDALGALVRKLGPRSPRGQAGAAVKPEEPFRE